MGTKSGIERFYTTIRKEGEAGATRGKIPVAMGASMKAKDGDVIEWEVKNGECVGGRVLTKSERKELEKGKADAQKEAKRAKKSSDEKSKSKSKSKSKPKSKKPVVSSSSDEPRAKKSKSKGKTEKKAHKTKTKVSYESSEAPKKKDKKKAKKSKKVSSSSSS